MIVIIVGINLFTWLQFFSFGGTANVWNYLIKGAVCKLWPETLVRNEMSRREEQSVSSVLDIRVALIFAEVSALT